MTKTRRNVSSVLPPTFSNHWMGSKKLNCSNEKKTTQKSRMLKKLYHVYLLTPKVAMAGFRSSAASRGMNEASR